MYEIAAEEEKFYTTLRYSQLKVDIRVVCLSHVPIYGAMSKRARA